MLCSCSEEVLLGAMGVVGMVSVWRWVIVIAIKIIASRFVLVNPHMKWGNIATCSVV